MTIKIIATDMDGTFLDEQGVYDKERFFRVLEELKARDMHFVVASGNSMSRLRPMFAESHEHLHFVAENGAQVISKGQVLVENYLDDKDLEAFITYFQDYFPTMPTIFNGRQSSYRLAGTRLHFAQEKITPEELAVMEASIDPIEDFRLIKDDVMKITSILSPSQSIEVSRAFNEAFDGNLVAVPSGFGAIDFIQKGIHKAWGLERLLQHLDLTPETLLAFGDGDNDIEMLAMAGRSYAMENASPKVLDVAGAKAPHHGEQGVLLVLEELLGLE